jgi:hypothetical protein
MSNHFHILVNVPPRPFTRVEDEEFFARLGLVYSSDVVEPLRKVVGSIRENPDGVNQDEQLERLVDELKAPYLRRMWDLS